MLVQIKKAIPELMQQYKLVKTMEIIKSCPDIFNIFWYVCKGVPAPTPLVKAPTP